MQQSQLDNIAMTLKLIINQRGQYFRVDVRLKIFEITERQKMGIGSLKL